MGVCPISQPWERLLSVNFINWVVYVSRSRKVIRQSRFKAIIRILSWEQILRITRTQREGEPQLLEMSANVPEENIQPLGLPLNYIPHPNFTWIPPCFGVSKKPREEGSVIQFSFTADCYCTFISNHKWREVCNLNSLPCKTGCVSHFITYSLSSYEVKEKSTQSGMNS